MHANARVEFEPEPRVNEKPSRLSHAGFQRPWAGQSIAALGDQLSPLALPLTAVAVLGANEAQMGLLTTAERAAHLAFGVLADVWVDRMRRKPILVASHVGRALLVASVPSATISAALGMTHVYVVGFLVTSIGVVAMVADTALLPALVGRDNRQPGRGQRYAHHELVGGNGCRASRRMADHAVCGAGRRVHLYARRRQRALGCGGSLVSRPPPRSRPSAQRPRAG